LVVTGRFGRNFSGGIERVAYEVCTRLQSRHELFVLGHKRIKDPLPETTIPYRAISSLNIPKTNFWVYLYIARKKRLIAKYVKEFKPEIIYAHNPYDTYASTGFGIPIISHIHSLYSEFFLTQESSQTILPRLYWKWFLKFRQNIEKKALSRSQLVITYSDFLADLARDRGAKQVFIIPNGIDTQLFSSIGNKLSEIVSPAVIYVGRIEKIKGMEYLAQAAAILPDIKFYLIGEKKADFNFPANVYLLGEKHPSEIPAYLRSADIFVNPVIRDGFEIVNLEAMACGIPVITTDAFERSSFYKDTAMLVRPENSDQLVHAIKMMLSDSSLRRKLVSAGTELSSKYDWSRIANVVEQKLIDAKGSPSK
jgi:glycosyltransferase involved in cell wall biosynthesis